MTVRIIAIRTDQRSVNLPRGIPPITADSGNEPNIGLSESSLRKKFHGAFVSPIYLMT